MNYGHHVRDLLLELKRSEDGSLTHEFHNSMDAATISIPAYNDVTVSNALQDFNLHVQALQEQVEAAALAASSMDTTGAPAKPSLSVRPSILLQNAACQRNKRGLLAYHWIRLQRLQEFLYWQSNNQQDGSILNHNHQNHRPTLIDDENHSSNVINHLCPAEIDFLYQYHNIMSKYTTKIAIPDISDLRAHCTLPPITVDRVLCRVVDPTPFLGDGTNNNSIVLESGQSVNFTFGSTHYLIYSDCEEFIRSGALQLLETEET